MILKYIKIYLNRLSDTELWEIFELIQQTLKDRNLNTDV